MNKKNDIFAWAQHTGTKRHAYLREDLARVNGGLSEDDRRNKYEKMSENPFAFYRGTAHLFYKDIHMANLLNRSAFYSEDAVTWIQGDLHIGNFGVFCDSEGDIVYDLNDFDEAWVASYLFDLWRGAASLALAARILDFRKKSQRKTITEFCREYLKELKKAVGKEGRNLDKVTQDKAHGTLENLLVKAEEKQSRKLMLDQWTTKDDGARRFNIEDPNIGVVSDDDQKILNAAIQAYKENLNSDLKGKVKYFRVEDTARRLNAGVGSLGTPRYYVLIRGESDHPDTSRILDVKQQGMPSYFPFLRKDEKERLKAFYPEVKAGHRVAAAQRAMLMDADKHLGAITVLGRSFSIRERSPYKKSLKLKKVKDFADFHDMAHHWGTILAGAHARSDKDFNKVLVSHNFEEALTSVAWGRQDKLFEEVVTFAMGYADQVEEDHKLFLEMREKGEIE